MGTPDESLPIAYVAFGSNILPEVRVPEALDLLMGHVEVLSVSTVYRCAALHRPEQADYRNGVLAIRSERDAGALKNEVLRKIEDRLGRRREEDRYAARTIDLDLILYGDAVVHEANLRLPDSDIYRRPFVAVPLLELAPDLVLPEDGTRLADLAVAHETDSLYVDETLTKILKGKLSR